MLLSSKRRYFFGAQDLEEDTRNWIVLGFREIVVLKKYRRFHKCKTPRSVTIFEEIGSK